MFKLSRYYSIASLVGITIICVVLALGFRHVAVNALIDSETRAKETLAQDFVTSIWVKYSDFVQRAATIKADQLIEQPEIAHIKSDVIQKMAGLNVIKVKIYNSDGLTVFSTDYSQIGEDHSANRLYQQARSDQTASGLMYRDSFAAIKETMVNRNVLATYLPIHDHEAGPVEAVFEVYSDVTELMASISKAQKLVFMLTFSSLLVLYIFLFVIVRRADKIIQQQYLERDIKEQKIRYQAFHDLLTGLPNRSSFSEHLAAAIKRSNNGEKPLAVMYLDLDRFKRINDSLGHGVGDDYLKVAAGRLAAAVRNTDSVFRMGGDEFTIILDDMDTIADATILAKRIQNVMNLPLELGGCEVIVTTSIGIAVYMQDGNCVETLVKNADAAMYQAKLIGRNNFKFYHQSMDASSLEHLALEASLQRALENDEYLLHYQPKIITATGAVAGAEALLRWQNSKYGLVPPNEFIPLLEDSNLIIPVGEWVIREACRQSKQWQESGLSPLRVSVNLSAQQFRQKSLPIIVQRILDDTGLDAQYLEIELTESILMDDTDEAIVLMQKLSDIGITISIDDFGTGYSSLSYLKKFPIDYLKIDQIFISGVAIDSKDAAITRGIIQLCQSLGIKLVAEGVEELAQYTFLKALGCEEVQGYYFSRPLEADVFARFQQAGVDLDERSSAG